MSKPASSDKAGSTHGRSTKGRSRNSRSKDSRPKDGQSIKNGPKKSSQTRSKVSEARQQSLKALKQVLAGQSLSAVQPATIDKLSDSRDRGLANEIVNGVLRWRWQLEFFVSRLLAKPLKKKDSDIQLVLLMALYELQACRTPDYAIINEAVELVRRSGKKWAASLVNAVLRRFTREHESLTASINSDIASLSHPEWIIRKLKADWPEHWQQILQANNQRPAFWLRVNQRQFDVERYQSLLSDNGVEFDDAAAQDINIGQAIRLTQGVDVRSLPGFDDGAVSVQDAAAQLSASLLDVGDSGIDGQQGQRVLDLCAAPGGKTCHLLEQYPSIRKLVAVELDAKRMTRVGENLQRLKLLPEDTDGSAGEVELVVADARDYERWWNGEGFDRILIDAPCSASGVIRRHPDIKSLRRETDIQALVELQAEILDAAWRMLAAGGVLLYVTCSIFKDENETQMQRFLSAHEDAKVLEITDDMVGNDWGRMCDPGRQLFPGEHDGDGFYFCRLTKLA